MLYLQKFPVANNVIEYNCIFFPKSIDHQCGNCKVLETCSPTVNWLNVRNPSTIEVLFPKSVAADLLKATFPKKTKQTAILFPENHTL